MKGREKYAILKPRNQIASMVVVSCGLPGDANSEKRRQHKTR